MPDNALKTPFGKRINELATERAQNEILLSGRALPCTVVSGNGRFVVVNFEVQSQFTLPQMQVPVASAEYFRAPIGPGCRGFVTSADYYLGGMSGLGGGVATLAAQGNLSNLVFVPIGNTGWPDVPAGFAVVYGPEGVILRTSDDAVSITIGPDGKIDMVAPGGVWMNGVRVDETHKHSDVQAGGDETGEVVP